LAQVNDKFTMIRSMSYTPIGLFNHTAAIYQLHTGYTADKVSPSGQLEPPSPADYPTMGSNIVRLKPPEAPMLPFVMLPRPLQESNVVGKGGTAGFLGKGYDPYLLYPDGDDNDMAKMERIKVEDLKLRHEVFGFRLQRRGMLEETMVIAVGEFGRSPQRGVSTSGNGNSADGRDHWPYCYTGLIAGGGIKRGYVHGKSDKTASAPIEKPVHPAQLLATIY